MVSLGHWGRAAHRSATKWWQANFIEAVTVENVHASGLQMFCAKYDKSFACPCWWQTATYLHYTGLASQNLEAWRALQWSHHLNLNALVDERWHSKAHLLCTKTMGPGTVQAKRIDACLQLLSNLAMRLPSKAGLPAVNGNVNDLFPTYSLPNGLFVGQSTVRITIKFCQVNLPVISFWKGTTERLHLLCNSICSASISVSGRSTKNL